MPGAKNFRIYRVVMSCQENGDRVQRQGRPAPRWLLWVRSIAPGFNRGEQSIANESVLERPNVIKHSRKRSKTEAVRM
jgi:hypothetical protein